VGIGALVVVDSVMNGFLREQMAVIRGTSSDVLIEIPKETRNHPALVEELLQQVRAADGVAGASLRLEAPCLYAKEGQVAASMGVAQFGGYHFVKLVGVDLESERQVSAFDQFLGGGRTGTSDLPSALRDNPFWFDPDHEWWQERVRPEKALHWPLRSVIFGWYLADVMNLRTGDVISMGTWSEPDADGKRHEVTAKFLIGGTFRTQNLEFDLTHAFVARQDLRDFSGRRAVGEEIIVACSEGFDETEVRDQLRQRLSGIPAPNIETWADRKITLLRAVENERRALVIVLFLMVVVAAFNLLVTLLMMVSEKVKDVGILTALGAAPLRVASVFLTCGLMVTIAGTILGLLAGLLVTWNINAIHDLFSKLTGLSLFNQNVYVFHRIPTEVDANRITVFVVATFLCTTLFTLLPAIRAARLNPVEALRHGS
jgi:ABC-type lipoprotein release transport system permease subunit